MPVEIIAASMVVFAFIAGRYYELTKATKHLKKIDAIQKEFLEERERFLEERERWYRAIAEKEKIIDEYMERHKGQ